LTSIYSSQSKFDLGLDHKWGSIFFGIWSKKKYIKLLQSSLDSSKLWELFLQNWIIRSANIFALRVIQTCKNSPHIYDMSKEINKNIILEFRNSSYRISNILSFYCIWPKLIFMQKLHILVRKWFVNHHVLWHSQRCQLIIQ